MQYFGLLAGRQLSARSIAAKTEPTPRMCQSGVSRELYMAFVEFLSA